MPTLRILFELANNQSIEAVEAQPHVCCAGSYENARRRAQPEHPATPAVTSGRANSRLRALQSNAAVRPHRSQVRSRCEDHQRARFETGCSAPDFPSASSPYSLDDPQRSRRGQSSHPIQTAQCACAMHPAYARLNHVPRKTPCASDHSARTQIPADLPLPGSAYEAPHSPRLHSCLHFNTDQMTTEEWRCSNAYARSAAVLRSCLCISRAKRRHRQAFMVGRRRPLSIFQAS